MLIVSPAIVRFAPDEFDQRKLAWKRKKISPLDIVERNGFESFRRLQTMAVKAQAGIYLNRMICEPVDSQTRLRSGLSGFVEQKSD